MLVYIIGFIAHDNIQENFYSNVKLQSSQHHSKRNEAVILVGSVFLSGIKKCLLNKLELNWFGLNSLKKLFLSWDFTVLLFNNLQSD